MAGKKARTAKGNPAAWRGSSCRLASTVVLATAAVHSVIDRRRAPKWALPRPLSLHPPEEKNGLLDKVARRLPWLKRSSLSRTATESSGATSSPPPSPSRPSCRVPAHPGGDRRGRLCGGRLPCGRRRPPRRSARPHRRDGQDDARTPSPSPSGPARRHRSSVWPACSTPGSASSALSSTVTTRCGRSTSGALKDRPSASPGCGRAVLSWAAPPSPHVLRWLPNSSPPSASSSPSW